MRPILLLFLILYALAVPVTITLYIIQEGIARRQIVAAGRLNDEPARVLIRDADGVEQQATLRFVNTHVVGAGGRIGNEIEEHLAILLALNLLSGALVFVMGIALWRTMPPTGWRLSSSLRWLAEKSRGELPHNG
jgi:hypothetical protein